MNWKLTGNGRKAGGLILLAGFGLLGGVAARSRALVRPAEDPRKEIEEFNEKLDRVTLGMDNRGVLELWAEDGVTLLPGMAPVEGKPNIAKFLSGLVAGLKGYRVTEQKSEFHSIEATGDWAFEWGTTFQVVQPPEGAPPISTHGKILLVLHRERGAWKLKQEMWNAGKNP